MKSILISIMLSHLIVVVTPGLADNKVKTQINETLNLLRRGEKEIVLNDKYKDVVLVLGNTGSGKSTFTQWVAGDNSKLIAKEVNEGTGEFIIIDNNRISNSTVTSKTIFPELVVDAKTNTAYYDCPGFDDTRSTSNDIAATYFIKKVVDHVKNIKLIFTISHHSLRIGVDRQDFIKLVKHITDFIKDTDTFDKSIAIVATKVDNQYVKEGKSFVLVEDEKVVNAIADFLQEVTRDLEDRLKHSSISQEESLFYGKAITFIRILLSKKNESYSKIGIFRRPDESGPLSNNALLQKGKLSIENLLTSLQFARKRGEFGYTISDKSLLEINDLVEEINENIWSNVNYTVIKVQEHYNDLAEQIRSKVRLFVTSAGVDANTSEAQTFTDQFNKGINSTSNLIDEIDNLSNPEKLGENLNTTLFSLGINICQDKILDVVNQGKYFNFLQTVTNVRLRTRNWIK